jgi:hypothetical protein
MRVVTKEKQRKNKDCHMGIGKTLNYAQRTARSKNGFFCEQQGQLLERTRQPLSLGDHLLARLVHQGSDPTLPYQALVIRESAMLWLGFAPWGR